MSRFVFCKFLGTVFSVFPSSTLLMISVLFQGIGKNILWEEFVNTVKMELLRRLITRQVH